MGAGRWQIFRRVQLPLLKPAIIIAVVIRSMEALKLFDQAVLLTYGGPGDSTQTIAFFLWRQVWQFNKYGFGAAAFGAVAAAVFDPDLRRHLPAGARARAPATIRGEGMMAATEPGTGGGRQGEGAGGCSLIFGTPS